MGSWALAEDLIAANRDGAGPSPDLDSEALAPQIRTASERP
jgi:hypothetical protein